MSKNKEILLMHSSEEVIEDYRLAYLSRQVSLIGRREVLGGRAKFGIFGDGKELPQIAMAKVFRPGDFRSGYYRDQTLMFAIGELSPTEFFSQLYSDQNIKNEPASGGRQMNAHFSTRLLDDEGEWKDLVSLKNSSSDVSPTASQMPRLVGLAYASKLYRELGGFEGSKRFSSNGDEIAFGTIGNASSAEGLFWESVNAISALQAPAVISIWDDDYGISVPNRIQFGKDLHDLLSGFAASEDEPAGFELFKVKGWDYLGLVSSYKTITARVRLTHRPAIIHVVELTQPQGHSTSGSHERYKTPDRLAWEKENDCLVRFREWILAQEISNEEELLVLEEAEHSKAEQARKDAWQVFKEPISGVAEEFKSILDSIQDIGNDSSSALNRLRHGLDSAPNLMRNDVVKAASEVLLDHHGVLAETDRKKIANFLSGLLDDGNIRVGSHLHSQSVKSVANLTEVLPIYSEKSPLLNGFEILNRAFDAMFERDPRVVAFGEDLGLIGGVNQGFSNLQAKYGPYRISDTGIREATILGQAIGLGMRGWRPIAEIQYLDYILYALQLMSDDLATLQWRTAGGQKAPVIIRTRGHRLEGVWHSGSPMGALVGLLRGVHIAVPRNMVQAVGFYNSLLESDEPGLVVEPLNGYRLKERLPDNLADFRLPFGVPELIREGNDVTVVTYGPLCNLASSAATTLENLGIGIDLIDVRTLLPFDISGEILESLKKTGRILFLDEDVPGGATAFMMQQVLERQGGYYWLDSAPRSLSAAPHRPAYGTDGNYFSKPNQESIIFLIYEMMRESNPRKYPPLT